MFLDDVVQKGTIGTNWNKVEQLGTKRYDFRTLGFESIEGFKKFLKLLVRTKTEK